ncbi:hypothetical protein B0H11DRAFT_1939206 [Mycena galericulata]|nr:hypothetical protein B0H11DRAFT_1939206 [Mycena galericulata]
MSQLIPTNFTVFWVQICEGPASGPLFVLLTIGDQVGPLFVRQTTDPGIHCPQTIAGKSFVVSHGVGRVIASFQFCTTQDDTEHRRVHIHQRFGDLGFPVKFEAPARNLLDGLQRLVLDPLHVENELHR